MLQFTGTAIFCECVCAFGYDLCNLSSWCCPMMIKEGCGYLCGLLFSAALPWCLSSHYVCALDLCFFRLRVFFFLLLSDVHQAGSSCHLCVRALQASCNKSITCCIKRLQGIKMRHYGASHSARSAWHRDEKNVKSFHYKEALLHFYCTYTDMGVCKGKV